LVGFTKKIKLSLYCTGCRA